MWQFTLTLTDDLTDDVCIYMEDSNSARVAKWIFDVEIEKTTDTVLPMLPASAGATAAEVLLCFLYYAIC